METICFILSFKPNPRMKRRIDVYKDSYDVNVIFQEGKSSYYGDILPDVGIVQIKKIEKNGGVFRLINLMYFTVCVMKKLCSMDPKILYVQNLDMLFVACLYKMILSSQAHIIYEIADLHPLIIDPAVGIIKKIVKNVLINSEKFLSKRIDLLVVTSEAFYEEYYKKFVPKGKLLYMPNMPDLKWFKRYTRKNEGPFTVGFIGMIRFKEQMKMLIEAADGLDIRVIFAGSESDEDNGISIKALAENNSQITYYGPYNYEENIAELYGKLDAVYAVYDTRQMDIRLALPNKLYESIYCEIPIIVADKTFLAEAVRRIGNGIVVFDNDATVLRLMLIKMRDDSSLYQDMVIACRNYKENMSIAKYNEKLRLRTAKLRNG